MRMHFVMSFFIHARLDGARREGKAQGFKIREYTIGRSVAICDTRKKERSVSSLGEGLMMPMFFVIPVSSLKTDAQVQQYISPLNSNVIRSGFVSEIVE